MEYNDKNLLDLYGQGLTFKQIGQRLHVTGDKARGRLRRIQKATPALVPVRKDYPSPAPKNARPKKVSPLPPTPTAIKFTPNRYTIGVRPRGYQQMSKSDLQAMLKQAVENTK